MAILGIKGHATRGKEVIRLLKMLGGENSFNLNGEETTGFYYLCTDNNKIYHCWINNENVIVYNLEDFEEKFRYKVGDKVIVWIDGYRSICNIQNMEWDYISE